MVMPVQYLYNLANTVLQVFSRVAVFHQLTVNNFDVFFADVFKFDPDFIANEEKYKVLKKGIYFMLILLVMN